MQTDSLQNQSFQERFLENLQEELDNYSKSEMIITKKEEEENGKSE